MTKSKKNFLLKLSQKKSNKLNILALSKLLPELTSDDVSFAMQFFNSYYNIDQMPDEFYFMLLSSIHSDKFKQLLNVMQTKNLYDLISFLKFGIFPIEKIENTLSPIEYFNLPHRHIERIIDHIKKLEYFNEDIPVKKSNANEPHWLLRRRSTNTKSEVISIAIKMYLTLGLDNTIELLSGKYGLIDYDIIYYLFNTITINKTSQKHIETFQEFLFGNKKDEENNMRQMLKGSFNELFNNFDYLYNLVAHFVEMLGKKLNKNKVSTLLKERYIAPNIENPELDGITLHDMIASYYNKYGISASEAEIINKNLQAYNEKLKKKTSTSIPKTDIPKIGDYTFDMISLTDARNLVMGYRAGNCFRINGNAFMLFNEFLTNPHMRLISISTDEYKDFGMILLMRNGNVLIAQGIETSNFIPDTITGEKLYEAAKEAIECIMSRINEEDDEIVASIIGLSNSNTAPYNHNILPFIINPLLEDNHQFYNGIDNYQALLAIKNEKTLRDIKLYTPSKLYNEQSHQIFRRSNRPYDSHNYREIEKILMSLRYAKFKQTPREEMIYYYSSLVEKRELYTICTHDWFITVFQDGSIDSFINSSDQEIINEYQKELDKIIKSTKRKRKFSNNQ